MYLEPVVHSGEPAADALPLAGGPSWFTEVIVHARGAAPKRVPTRDLEPGELARLTTPRLPLAGLAMNRTQVMGILNVTPDSFSDGGLFTDIAAARAQAERMAASGVTILDIGGESTRPGADTIPDAVEIDRTCPVIEAVRDLGMTLSIDTRKAAVAEAALAAGAEIVNDVAALTYDPGMAPLVARSGAPVCLMHARGDPKTMQDAPHYDNVLLDVYDWLAARIEAAMAAGIAREAIMVDPGIGFGKTLEHNLTLLRGIALFHGLGCPVLLGASRKRFIGVIGNAPEPADRMPGSVAIALHAARQGVQIIRVHDTAETQQALALQAALMGR